MNTTHEIRCCMPDCGKEAEFSIHEMCRRDPDNETHACEEHVGSLLGYATSKKDGGWNVYPLAGGDSDDTRRSPG